MSENTDASEEARILTYARLIDPEVWHSDGVPLDGPLTLWRVKASIEAACRIAAHDGDLSGSDIGRRLFLKLGIEETQAEIKLPEHVSAPDLSVMIGILTGDISQVAPPSEREDPEDVQPKVDQDPAEDGEPDASDGDDDGADYGSSDPNHDAEEGISHVGDADEGQYHEEL